MSDRLTFACSQCQSPFSVERQLLGQAIACPSCGGICPLPREAVEIPPHDPRITDQLIERVIKEQVESNRRLGHVAGWIVACFLLALCIMCGGLAVRVDLR